jgi:hypothetical protein
MISELVMHLTNVIERNGIWKEYMEVEGEREVTGRCRSVRQQRVGVVAGTGSRR